MDRPTLRQLEILAEVARVGTFRGAARSLGVSQVAVSDHIRQLETRLGCALFVRNAGGRPSLSASGQVVLDHGRNVLFACDALISAARGVSVSSEPVVPPQLRVRKARAVPVGTAPGEGVVTPGDAAGSTVDPDVASISAPAPLPQSLPLPPSAAFTPFVLPAMQEQDAGDEASAPGSDPEKPITIASHPAILSRFQDKLAAAQDAFPERPIAVDFARFTADGVGKALRNGEADIALFYALGDVHGLASDYLWSESWSLFARADHPLARQAALTLQDCMDMPVILFDAGNPLRILCEHCLADSGLWPAPTVLETDDFSRIAVELDYGEAVFPTFGVTAAQFAAQPGLRRLALVEPLRPVQVRRAVGASAQEDPTIAALAGILG